MAQAQIKLSLSPTEVDLIEEALEAHHDEYADQVADVNLRPKERRQAHAIVEQIKALLEKLRRG